MSLVIVLVSTAVEGKAEKVMLSLGGWFAARADNLTLKGD